MVRDVEFTHRTAGELQPPRQCRRLADHLHRVGEEDTGLFALGYIARRSGHSRGSTVDLGIVPADATAIPPPDPAQPLRACTAPKGERFEDGTIDFGTGYDCLDVLAHMSADVGVTARSNRQMLRSAMQSAGFRPYARKWWHIQLNNEPFDREFNFEVTARP